MYSGSAEPTRFLQDRTIHDNFSLQGVHTLQQRNSRRFTGLYGFAVLDTGLNFADVGAAHHQHGKPGLADTAADGQRQFAV